MKTPSISVLLCTNLFDDYFKLAVDSILNQTISDYEIIVVANGVDDDVWNQIAAYCTDERYCLLRTHIRHLPFSLNLGLHHCSAPLVARMDADDVSRPDRLERQLEFMAVNKDITVCGTYYRLIDKSGRVVRSVKLPISDKNIRRKMYFNNPICHPSVMFRREDIISVGGYPGSLFAEDFDLWLLLCQNRKIKYANIPIELTDYRSISLGSARRSRRAYANVASAYLRNAIITKNILWLLGAFSYTIKAIVLANRP